MRRALREFCVNLWPGNVPADTAARSVAVGALLGLMPLFGLPTPLCALVAGIFRLNLPLTQAGNYLVYPLQIALVIPFYKLGEWMYLSPGVTRSSVWATACHTLTAWLCVSGPLAIMLYIGLCGFLRLGGLGLLTKRSATQSA